MNNILSSSFEMEDDLLEEKKEDQSSHEKVYEVSPVVSDDMIDVHQVPAYIWSFALHLKKERNFTVSQILEQLGKKACVEAINAFFFSFLFISGPRSCQKHHRRHRAKASANKMRILKRRQQVMIWGDCCLLIC
jgi:hypothetical protein